MKFAELTSIAHNLATSISDGASFLFGAFGLDVHGDAQSSPEGRLTIDFLASRVVEGRASKSLLAAIERSQGVLIDLCSRHGATPAEFAQLEARYGVDQVYGPHFRVIVENHAGRRSEEIYEGISGRRLRRGHRSTRPSS